MYRDIQRFPGCIVFPSESGDVGLIKRLLLSKLWQTKRSCCISLNDSSKHFVSFLENEQRIFFPLVMFIVYVCDTVLCAFVCSVVLMCFVRLLSESCRRWSRTKSRNAVKPELRNTPSTSTAGLAQDVWRSMVRKSLLGLQYIHIGVRVLYQDNAPAFEPIFERYHLPQLLPRSLGWMGAHSKGRHAGAACREAQELFCVQEAKNQEKNRTLEEVALQWCYSRFKTLCRVVWTSRTDMKKVIVTHTLQCAPVTLGHRGAFANITFMCKLFGTLVAAG